MDTQKEFDPDEAVDLTKQQADQLESIQTVVQLLQNQANLLINQAVENSEVEVGDKDVITYSNGKVLVEFAEEEDDDAEDS